MIRRYEINKRNSTVCGYPGRDFDWTKFDWKGGVLHKFEGRTLASEPPTPDTGLIAPGNQYLHVSYDWVEHGTIYRVRPNESMRAGQVYRGHLITQQRAVEIDGKWYWELEQE